MIERCTKAKGVFRRRRLGFDLGDGRAGEACRGTPG